MGEKHDTDKLRFELLDPQFLAEMAKVLTLGAKKYADNSWQTLPYAKQRYTGALHRHMNEFQQGRLIDLDWPQDYTSHLAQVAVNAMFLYWLSNNSKEEVKN